MKHGLELANASGVQIRTLLIQDIRTLWEHSFSLSSLAERFYHYMRTERINIDQVRTQLADLITFASEGGEVIIMQDGKLLARLIAATDPAAYQSLAPAHAEFSSDEGSLAWDADGWEEIA